MVIGFDASRAFTNKRTGTENYSYQLLLHLAEMDRKNTYHIFLRPAASQGATLRGWPSNFKLITLPYPRLWTQVGLAKQTFIDKLDILFVPAHTLPLIRRPHLLTVVTVHDLGAEYLPTMHQLKQRLYLNLMTNFQLKSATHLIAVSKATKKDLIQKVGPAASKISVIYEGYNQKLFQPVKDALLRVTLKQFDLESEKYFLFVGTIQPRKNLERLIGAYAQFLTNIFQRGGASQGTPRGGPSLVSEVGNAWGWRATGPRTNERQDSESLPKLVLTGGKGWLSDEIYQLPQKLGIENQVKFLGYVPDEKLPALYSGALAFIFPSLYEGFGLPILEAMACGTPVITSNVSSMPEVGGRAALYVDPYDVKDITNKLKLTMEDKEVREEMIKEGYQQVKKFSWEKCARKTVEVLESVAISSL